MRRLLIIAIAVAVTAIAWIYAPAHAVDSQEPCDSIGCVADTVSIYLTDEDIREVADSLQVDIPAIHAVIDIEAGYKHQGFWTEGKPVINFSLSQFRREAQKRGINLAKYSKSHAVVFAGPNRSKYGSQQAAQQARLDAAMSIDSVAAINSTFWGMFQIGGFNWKKCGAQSPQEFFERMSASERDQLQMFANFLRSTKLDKPLQQHDWHKFARGYNGSSYASRGYHTKLSNAYKRWQQKLSETETN